MHPVQRQDVNQPKSNKTIFIILGIVVVVIVIVIIFLMFNSSEDGSGAEISATIGGIKSGSIIRCEDIPKDFNVQDESYLESHPEVKDSLLCISEAFNDCDKASIKFLDEEYYYLFKTELEGSECKVSYQYENKAIECTYNKEQTKMLHQVAVDNDQAWATGFSIMFSMGMELLRFENKKTIEQTITNKDTGAKEKIPCRFYWEGSATRIDSGGSCTPITCIQLNKRCGEWEDSCGNLIDCGDCEEGKRCVNGELCLSEDLVGDNQDSSTATGNMVMAWGREVEEGALIDMGPGDCLYEIFLSCDIFQNGCVDSGISALCEEKCEGNGKSYSGSHGTLDNDVIQCGCSGCDV